MGADLWMGAGIVLAAIAVMGMLAALIEGRSMRLSILSLLIAGSMIVYANVLRPGGYGLAEIPHVFVRLVAAVI